jgi:hypothetical protein
MDSSGNLSLVSGILSQWITLGLNINYNAGNVGIGKTPAVTLDVSGNISCSGTWNNSGVPTFSYNIYINTTTNLSRLTLRMSYNNGNTGGLCIDSGDNKVYNFKLIFICSSGISSWI